LDWDAATAFDVQNKGWYDQAELQMDDGRIVPLSFWDPVRLSQEIKADFESGKRFFTEQNLIVLPMLTEESIRNAVSELLRTGRL
jgi:hypothetical protein